MSEHPNQNRPDIQFESPRREQTMRKPRRESEDEREMRDSIMLENLVDEVNAVRLKDAAVFDHLPKIGKFRDEAFKLGAKILDGADEEQLRFMRQWVNRYAKRKGLSDPDELLSRSVFELSVRMGRRFMALHDQRKEAQRIWSLAFLHYKNPTGREVREFFFGKDRNKVEVYHPEGAEYAFSSIVGQQASHVRKVMTSPDSGKMVLLQDMHQLELAAQPVEDRRKARMERELGAILDQPERFVDGEWIPVEGHDPDDPNQSHVKAAMAADARDMLKGWHMGSGAAGGTVLQTMHNVQDMRAAETRYLEELRTDTLRRSWQATIRFMVRNAYARRKLALANADQYEEIYSDKDARAEEIVLRMVEGLKQAKDRNDELPDNVLDYLLARYMPEELRDRNARFMATPGTVFQDPGTKIVPGTELPQRTIPVWNEESGMYDWVPDGTPRIAQGMRFGAGWDIGRMGDVTAHRRLNFSTMSKETKVKEGDLRFAMRIVGKKAAKLANRFIDHMAIEQVNRFHAEPIGRELLNDHGLVVRHTVRPMPVGEHRHGTDLVEGHIPGVTPFRYEKRTEVTMQKMIDGVVHNCTKTTVITDPVVLQITDETCQQCNEHKVVGRFKDGTRPTVCAECRGVELYAAQSAMAHIPTEE